MNRYSTKRDLRTVAGFSLVELMITLALAAFLISALILAFLSARVAATDGDQLSRMQENVRIISEYLVRDIRNAGYIDEVDALVGQDVFMRRQFAAIEGGNRLRVRYAGRGHCGEQFNQLVLVENEYFVDMVNGVGILFCRGRHVPASVNVGSASTWDSVLINPNTVELISGVSAVRFSPLNPVAVTNCQFNYTDTPGSGNPLLTSCVGVQIDVDLIGVRGDVRQLSLVAGFRNVILERLNNGIPAS
jgi:hypothetical protein